MNKKDTKPEEFSYSGNNLDDLLNGLSTGSQSKAPAPQKKTPAAAASEQEHLHDGHRERLRQKFAEGMSFDGLSDHEIIELLLFYCIPRADVNELAHKLLRLFGGFTGVLNASYSQLCAVTGLGEQSAMYLKILMRLCAKYNLEMQQCISVTNAESLYDYMIYQFSGESDECAKLFLVDKQGKLGTPHEIGRGLEDKSVFSFKKAMNIISNAPCNYIILAHNHSSGSSAPSENDVVMTRRFRQMLDPIGVSLIDHFVIAGTELSSMRKLGMLDL